MASDPLAPLQRQIARVRRRLFIQGLVRLLVGCWAGALVLSALGFLVHGMVQPLFPDYAPEDWHRWAAAGGVVVAATLLAVGWTLLRAPSKPQAALALDEQFKLKERVTTALLLTPEQRASPAGEALLADVQERLAGLDVGSRFPIRLSWSALLVPACAGLLALVSFVPPLESQATAGSSDDKAKVAARDQKDIDQKINELRKKNRPADPTSDKSKSEKLKELEDKLDKIFNKERETKEQLRDRVREMSAVEKEMKDRARELGDKTVAVKQQLQQLNQMMQKDAKDGPAKDLQKALAQGKFDKAQEEIERLAKKLKDGELNEKDKEQLKRQLEDIQKKLSDLAQQKDKEEQLKQLEREGKLDAETLKRELDQLKQDSQKLQDLQELAKMAGECQECLKKGDGKGASKSMQEMAKKMQSMGNQGGEMQELREQLQRLQEAKESMCRGCEGNSDKSSRQRAGQGKGKNPGGRRQVGEEAPFKSFDDQAKLDYDSKGRQSFDGYAPGQNYRKPSKTELEGEIERASQEAPAAIEAQRIPKVYRESAKGYFRNIGGQVEKEKKEEKKPE
jgi:uncharacterized coiled-coil DUF342 family protein